MRGRYLCTFFFFNDTATTEIYTLSLHDALPILNAEGDRERDGEYGSRQSPRQRQQCFDGATQRHAPPHHQPTDRKSTRLNSSHLVISYAVFCLKKKKRSRPS